MTFEPLSLATALLAGVVLGAGYMAALWAAVHRLTRSPHPLALLLGGALVRVGALLALLYLVMDGDALRLLAALAGFVATRTAVAHWAGRRGRATR